jgi:rhodanese-related sulfurtransferase
MNPVEVRKTMSKKSSVERKKLAAKAAAKKKQNNTLLMVGGIGLVVLIAVAAIFLLGNQNQASAVAGIPAEISVEQAYQKYEDGAFVLDVRTQEEWDDYHAPGTTLIPLDQLASRVNELPQDQEIVVICRSGNRSQEGRDILKAAGFANVTSVSGGLSAWRSAGFPVEP